MTRPSHPAGIGAALGAAISGLLRELPAMVSDRVELLALELHRAGLALLHITCLGMALTVLALGGWFLLWALITAALVAGVGLHWAAALGAVLLVHGLLGWWVVSRIRRLLPTLGLPATRRQLTFPKPAATQADDPPESHAPVSTPAAP